MATKQKQGKSHKLRRSSKRSSACERQWLRTAKNKLKRINYQRELAGLPLLVGHNFVGKDGKQFYMSAR
jgi:hypothetical protein